jgi:hypothetical protein
MAQRSSTTLMVMGLFSTFLGLGLLIFLVVWRRDELFDMIMTGIGDPKTAAALGKKAGPIGGYVTIWMITFLLELVLAFILFWTGFSLVILRPWARWAAIFGSIFLMVVELFNVVLQIFHMTPRGAPIEIAPVLISGGAILFAIVLCGTMFLPEVRAAYATPEGEE